MAEHIRLRAMKVLCSLIETETGLRVFRGRQVVGTDIPRPFFVINEAIRSGNTTPDASNMSRNDRIDFLLSGYTEVVDIENPTDAGYDLMYKVEVALHKIHALTQHGNPKYKEWYNLGGLVTNFKYQAPICHNPPDDVQSNVYFYIPFSFHVAYTTSNPEGIAQTC